MPSLFKLWLSNVPTFFMLLLTILTLCRKVPVLNMTSLRSVSLGCRVLTHVRIQPWPVAGPCREERVRLSPSSAHSAPHSSLRRPGLSLVSALSHSADTSGASRLACTACLPHTEFLPAGLKPAVLSAGSLLAAFVSCPVPFTKSCKLSVVGVQRIAATNN